MHFNSLRKKLFNSHIEKRSGSALQASDYCKKDGTFEMRGTITVGQGKRTDIDNAVEMIQDGNSMSEIAKAMPSAFVKFNKGFKALKCALVEPRNEVPLVQVFWGPTGTGKSHGARVVFKDSDYYVWTPARGKWWDHYEGQKNIILEEFVGQLPYRYLLSLLDRYDCPIEYKGGSCEFVGTKIIITSPKHPSTWYARDECSELMRRLSQIIEFNEVYKA